MEDSRLSRRKFVLSAIAASSVLATTKRWLPGNDAWAAESENSALTRLSRLLFPHPGLADVVYADVAASLFTSFSSDSANGQLLDAAASALDAQVGGNWFGVDEDRQVAAIRNIQGEAFFAAILAGLRGAFYYHPAVWSHLGYPGSSKEHGGYKHRGFNDIDWLPEIE